MFESAGWSLSSPLRGCFNHAEEFHVCLDKGMEQSDESLCGHHADVRSLRMWFLKRQRMPRTRSVA